MHFEPVPTRSPGRHPRAAAIASILGPPLALLAVVSVALLGPSTPPERQPPALEADSHPRPTASGTQAADPPVDRAGRQPPAVAFRLATRSVEDALRLHRVGALGDGPVAVTGYLTLEAGQVRCPGDGTEPSSTFCARMGWLSSGPGRSPRAAHVHPQFLPGTPAPEATLPIVDRRFALAAVPAVVIGRFDDPRAAPCVPRNLHCGEEFVVERVAWLAGEWLDQPVVVDPALPPGAAADRTRIARLIALREADRGEVILSRALLTPEGLRTVDPAAAAALPDGLAGPIWYVRSVSRPTGRTSRAVTWAVLDDATGRILALG